MQHWRIYHFCSEDQLKIFPQCVPSLPLLPARYKKSKESINQTSFASWLKGAEILFVYHMLILTASLDYVKSAVWQKASKWTRWTAFIVAASSHPPPTRALWEEKKKRCVRVSKAIISSQWIAPAIISVKRESKLGGKETEAIQMAGNRADLISVKYL